VTKESNKPQKDWREVLRRLDEVRWELPVDYMPGMRVPGLIFANDALIETMATDMAVQQVANVATLPGIVGHSIAMPDIHWGYGFPIGGIAATRVDDGVVSPGGVGFDINCGVRLLRTSLHKDQVTPKLKQLLDQIFRDVPAGAGKGTDQKMSSDDQEGVLEQGAAWAVGMGYGTGADLDVIESGGALPGADVSKVSNYARKRGMGQLGTLGSGNHFLEIQVVSAIYDDVAAKAFGLNELNQVVVFIHTGSRGLGHQVCQDYLGKMQDAMTRYGIELPDKQLACAPVQSYEGREYLGAMNAAANFAFANRQAITAAVRNAFKSVLGVKHPNSSIPVVYDVAHNIAKFERYEVDGQQTELCVHRKGATRAFPAGHPDIPEQYRDVGQPVLVPGDMGRYSFVCVGQGKALQETWGSTCHGAGRVLSRGEAKRTLEGVNIEARLKARGIQVRAQNKSALAEESSEAYKDVQDVVHVLQDAGIANVVAQLRPLGVIKG
jgi:tRNA-splicing ligase RtcB (3'-phosphate/5'-hydroxy nucleic acid ligase)